jgi:hypothetical protein
LGKIAAVNFCVAYAFDLRSNILGSSVSLHSPALIEPSSPR